MNDRDLLLRLKGLSPEKLLLLAASLHEKLERRDRDEREACAIVGMACRLPGDVTSPDAFWSALEQGRDLVGDLAPERAAAMRASARGESLPPETMRGGFLRAVDEFDADFFGISPREAAAMDPQQRILLEIAVEALERAAIPVAERSARRVGVFVGAMGNDYLHVVRDAGAVDAFAASGNDTSFLAGRLSHALMLRGPSMTVGAACSSSAVAFHLAMKSLRRRECDVALVAGVNVIVTPLGTLGLHRMGLASKDGRARSFDAGADGYGRGEGAAALVLQRASDARAEGRVVFALARGSASGHPGGAASATIPSGPGQQEVVRAALADAGVSPADVSYVEMQGPATRMGDAIEANALGAALEGAARPVYVGALKTSTGHLEAASGVVAILKTALALRRRAIPRMLHRRDPSPEIPWDRLPFVLPTETVAWTGEGKGAPRTACVHSFGLSGTVAHVVLQEAPPPDDDPAPPSAPQTFVLSAKTADALRRAAQAHAAALAVDRDVDLVGVCRTAATGRATHEHRLAVVASSIADIVDALFAFAEGRAAPDLFVGRAGLGAPPGPATELSPTQVAERFCAGAPIEWSAVFPGPPRLCVLATSPWNHARHWIRARPDAAAVLETKPSAPPPVFTGEGGRPLVRDTVAGVLGIAVEHVDTDTAFVDLGMTSLGAAELGRLLTERTGVPISATNVLAYPTVDALTGFVATELAATRPSS